MESIILPIAIWLSWLEPCANKKRWFEPPGNQSALLPGQAPGCLLLGSPDTVPWPSLIYNKFLPPWLRQFNKCKISRTQPGKLKATNSSFSLNYCQLIFKGFSKLLLLDSGTFNHRHKRRNTIDLFLDKSPKCKNHHFWHILELTVNHYPRLRGHGVHLWGRREQP